MISICSVLFRGPSSPCHFAIDSCIASKKLSQIFTLKIVIFASPVFPWSKTMINITALVQVNFLMWHSCFGKKSSVTLIFFLWTHVTWNSAGWICASWSRVKNDLNFHYVASLHLQTLSATAQFFMPQSTPCAPACIPVCATCIPCNTLPAKILRVFCFRHLIFGHFAETQRK